MIDARAAARPAALPWRAGAAAGGGAILAFVVVVGLAAAVAIAPTAAFGALFLLAVVVAVLTRPDLATPLVIFLLFVNAPSVAVNTHGAPFLLGAAMSLLLLVPLAFHLVRGERLVFAPPFGALLLLLVAQVASTIASSNVPLALENVKTFVLEGVVLFLLVTNVVRSPQVLRHSVWAMIAAGAFLGGATWFQQLTGTYYRTYGGFAQADREFFLGLTNSPRLVGPIGDPNYFAQVLLPIVVVALLLGVAETTRRRRVAALGATVAGAVAIALTSSRGAALALLLVIGVMVFLGYIGRRGVVTVAVGLVALLVAFPGYRERVLGLNEQLRDPTGSSGIVDSDPAVQGRTSEMIAALQVFGDHPVLGVGPGVFPSYYQDYAAEIGIGVHQRIRFGAKAGEVPERESHNMLLSVASETGALGLVLFVGVILAALRGLHAARVVALRQRPELAVVATALALALLAYVAAGLFLTLAYERYFWLLIALAAAAARVIREASLPAAPARRPQPALERPSPARPA